MGLLLITIGVVIVAYIAFVLLFPKAIPEETSQHTRDALKQIMEETQGMQAGESTDSILKSYFENENEFIKIAFSLPVLKSIYPLIIQAGLQHETSKVLILMLAALMLITGLFFMIGLGPLALILGPLLTFLLTRMRLNGKIQKRNAAFINLFPDVLDMFVRSVKSGFPVTSAFKMVAENMEEPVASEFQQVVNELGMGLTMTQVLSRLAERINEPDIQFFVVVMKVQQETGGNLAEVVSNLSNVIRKRKQLRMKIRAMTSEGRATSYILGGLPIFIFGILYVLQKEYLEPLWTTSMGMVLLGCSISLIVLCMWIVNQMIKIDI